MDRETNWEIAILEALFNYFTSHPGEPAMTFTQLYEAVGISLRDNKSVGEVWHALFCLQRQELVRRESLADGSGGIVEIEPKGVKIIQDRQKTIAQESSSVLSQAQKEDKDESAEAIIEMPTVETFPTSLEDFIQRDQICARLIQRDELLHEITEYLTHPSKKCHFIVLYGQPMVGKTKMLVRLSEALGNAYIPLMVTGQGLNVLDNLDAFTFDLADQLTIEVKKHHRGPHSLSTPKWDDFKGKGARAFYTYWHQLRQYAGNRTPIVIFDEIEHLLDYPEKLEPQIFTFLDDFVRKPENGYFIFAGSERIQYSKKNEDFSTLIAKGEAIRVSHYDEETVLTIFSAVQKYLACEDRTLQPLIALCDGQPRVLLVTLETIFSRVNRLSSKQSVTKSDLESIISETIERMSNFLWMLQLRLSEEERSVVRLISRKVSGLVTRLWPFLVRG